MTDKQPRQAIALSYDGVNAPSLSAKETLIKATRPGFFVHEAATPKFASS